MAKKGLGKGIDVLIPQAKEKTKSEKENIDCCTAQIKNAQVCNEILENQIAARLGAPEYEHRFRQSQVKKDRWLICNAKKVY